MRASLSTSLLLLALSVGTVMPCALTAGELTTQPQPKLARDDPKRVVCRRLAVTGSLVQTVKMCKTNAEWRGQARDAQDEATQMQQRGLVNSCGSSEPGKC
jgi:hypothetical protein